MRSPHGTHVCDSVCMCVCGRVCVCVVYAPPHGTNASPTRSAVHVCMHVRCSCVRACPLFMRVYIELCQIAILPVTIFTFGPPPSPHHTGRLQLLPPPYRGCTWKQPAWGAAAAHNPQNIWPEFHQQRCLQVSKCLCTLFYVPLPGTARRTIKCYFSIYR